MNLVIDLGILGLFWTRISVPFGPSCSTSFVRFPALSFYNGAISVALWMHGLVDVLWNVTFRTGTLSVESPVMPVTKTAFFQQHTHRGRTFG